MKNWHFLFITSCFTANLLEQREAEPIGIQGDVPINKKIKKRHLGKCSWQIGGQCLTRKFI